MTGATSPRRTVKLPTHPSPLIEVTTVVGKQDPSAMAGP